MSDYTYDNMVKQVKAVFSESKQEQSEEKIKVKVEDESCELEQTFYSNMRSEARVRWEVHIEVNIKILGEKGVKGKKNPIDRSTGEILRCNICESIFLLEIVQIMCQGSLKRKMR